jgi:hypothetical protein
MAATGRAARVGAWDARAPEALLLAVEPDELDGALVLRRAGLQDLGERVELRGADTIIHRALAEVPRVEVAAHDDGVGGAAGKRGDDVGGLDLRAIRLGLHADAHSLAALDEAEQPVALFLRDAVDREAQRLAGEGAGAGEELAAGHAVDEEDAAHPVLESGLFILAARHGGMRREQADLAAGVELGEVLLAALADVDDLGLEFLVRLRVAERGDAQRALERREEHHLVLTAHPAGHLEFLEPGLDAERLEFGHRALQRALVGGRASEAAAKVVTETREELMACGIRERIGHDRVLHERDRLGTQWRGKAERERSQGKQNGSDVVSHDSRIQIRISPSPRLAQRP